jgi:capsular polysaccharide export protein
LTHARGTVVINSTVGLSSILHGTPVITLGKAIYDMPGLTCQGGLDAFWAAPGHVDRRLYRRFRAYLVAHNQANGNFYRRLPGMRNPTGVDWPAACEGTRGFASYENAQRAATRAEVLEQRRRAASA